MKNLIIIFLFFILCSCSNELYEQYNPDTYGDTWTKLFKAKSEKQAEWIVKRYKKANIGQEYFIDDGKYYIEFAYHDDDLETFENGKLIIPKRMRDQIMIIEFLTINGKNTLSTGVGKLKLY